MIEFILSVEISFNVQNSHMSFMIKLKLINSLCEKQEVNFFLPKQVGTYKMTHFIEHYFGVY